jgi:hypothetical protein
MKSTGSIFVVNFSATLAVLVEAVLSGGCFVCCLSLMVSSLVN